jgi:DUF4097 and DUF4098 domain-containing protein YvlB
MYRKLILAAAAMGVTGAAWADYEEVRELSLDTRGIDTLEIDAGAGSLDVVGADGASEITVVATIQVDTNDEEEAREIIEDRMVLVLEKDSDTAKLNAWFEDGGWNWGRGDSPRISLEVRMPNNMHLNVDDGSGSIEIENVRGDIVVDDGSGSLEMRDVGGEIEIEDGSGSISVAGVGGNISINDGSGSIKVRDVAGSVTVDDGSGSIDVSDVEEDLIIVDDGSGGLDFSNIGGRVEKES